MLANLPSGDPLDGLTVVDLTRYVPGPYCTRLLADLGAAVIKVEAPAGDPMRGIGWYDLLNTGKRIVRLDLAGADGRAELERLLSRADVCVEGFRPQSARALGVDGPALAARFPALVHCSISGYGQRGPDASRAGHDLNYQAGAGLLDASRRMPALLVADITAGLHATIAILAALGRRHRTGAGAVIDVSLAAAAASWAAFLPPPTLRGDYACYNLYETADGAHVALGALEPKFWAAFCRHVGREAWIPEQFAPDPRRTALLDEVRALFRSRTSAEWEHDLLPIDCCVSIVGGGAARA